MVNRPGPRAKRFGSVDRRIARSKSRSVTQRRRDGESTRRDETNFFSFAFSLRLCVTLLDRAGDRSALLGSEGAPGSFRRFHLLRVIGNLSRVGDDFGYGTGLRSAVKRTRRVRFVGFALFGTLGLLRESGVKSL